MKDRFNGVNTRLDRINGKVVDHSERITRIEEREKRVFGGAGLFGTIFSWFTKR